MGYYLMHRDTPVVDIDNAIILNQQLAPYPLRIRQLNKDTIYKWLKKRAVPLNRKNADKLYQAVGLPRNNMEYELIILTHGLSINDNYWIANRNEIGKLLWKDINLYNNKLSSSLSYLAFTGSGPVSVTSNELSAEFTGQGTYAKCFIRNNGGLEIYKQGTNKEIAAEVISSYICKVLGIPCIDYEYRELFGQKACVSKIFTNEKISWESAFWFTSYTEAIYGVNVYEFAEKHFKYMYYAQMLIDGLLLNEDRHLQNWSIQLSGETNEIISMAPLYDFNKSFTGDNNSMSPFIPGKNILYAAREAEKVLQIDLVTLLLPVIKHIPSIWQEAFHNRILYITGNKGNQRDCY